jgi:hypothetical protein
MKLILFLVFIANIFSASFSYGGRYLFEIVNIVKLPGGCTIYNVDVFYDHDTNYNTHNPLVANMNIPVGCPPNLNLKLPPGFDSTQNSEYGSDYNERNVPDVSTPKMIDGNYHIDRQNQMISTNLGDYHADLLLLTDSNSGNSLFMESLDNSGTLTYSLAPLAEGEYIAYILDIKKMTLLRIAFEKDF